MTVAPQTLIWIKKVITTLPRGEIMGDNLGVELPVKLAMFTVDEVVGVRCAEPRPWQFMMHLFKP